MKQLGISKREFARRVDCSESLVRKKIAQGRLLPEEDGTLDPALVDAVLASGWDGLYEPGAHTAHGAHSDMERLNAAGVTGTQSTDEISSTLGISKLGAERVKEVYLARLRQLEYETKSGLVISKEDAAAAWEEHVSNARARLLNIPTKLAPLVAMESDMAGCQDLIKREIHDALTELSQSGSEGSSG